MKVGLVMASSSPGIETPEGWYATAMLQRVGGQLGTRGLERGERSDALGMAVGVSGEDGVATSPAEANGDELA